jgi:hypothetical protein
MTDDLSGIRPPTFSQRYGHEPYPPPLQLSDLDDRTRTDLWNFIYMRYIEPQYQTISWEAIWMGFLARYKSEYNANAFVNSLFQVVADRPFPRVFDLIEYLLRQRKQHERPGDIEIFNQVLALNRVGYRVGPENLVVPITSEEELAAVSAAADNGSPGAREHIRRAIRLFADRDNPQFAKSISESMLAAEAAAQQLAGLPRVPLGDAVDALRRKGQLHGALAEGWKKLYGYSSQDGGIRHAMQPDSLEPSQELAQYFLVTASAFVNLCSALTDDPAED